MLPSIATVLLLRLTQRCRKGGALLMLPFTVLVLYCVVAGPFTMLVLPSTALVLPIYCIGVPYLLYWCCLSTVLVLPIYCIGVAITELVLLHYSHLFVLRSCWDLIAVPSLGGADHVIL